jgi:hypothetical protein
MNLRLKGNNYINKSTITINNRKGSIFIEAAIFLPIIILLVLNLSYLIKVIYFQEEVFHSLVNEGRRISLEAHLYKLQSNNEIVNTIIEHGPQNKIIFTNRITSKLKLNDQKNIAAFNINEFKFMYRNNQIEDLIRIQIDYKVKNNFNKIFNQNFYVNQVLLIRSWTGKTNIGTPYSFKYMEEEISSNLVYVYPRSGEKYHSLNCSYIQSYPQETILTSEIKSKYEPCKICESSNIFIGELIYIFYHGKNYHLGNCQMVNKYIISIDKNQAENEGYLRCDKCNGGN